MGSSATKNRFYASLIHFSCSLLIAFIVVALVFWIWYPGAIASAAGVTEIFFLVLIVDVCLGPLLTFVVFNIEKKELKRDLLIIFLIQVSALFYGIYTVGVARPAYVVFAIDRFELVYAKDLTQEQLTAAHGEYKTVPLWGPQWVSAHLPKDVDERNDLLFRSLEGEADLAQLPQYYLPYSESQNEVVDKLRPLDNLKQYNGSNLDGYNDLIARYSTDLPHYGYLPLQGDFMDLVVVIDKDTAEVIEVTKLKPWG